MKKTIISSIILSVLFLVSTAFALENLDELEARVSRKSTHTFYSGESAENHYVWQPQTVIYQDTSTNHEMWFLTQTPDYEAQNYSSEYGGQPWSADGKRFGFSLGRASTSQWTQTSYDLMMVSRSDGSMLRPAVESTYRGMGNRQNYFNWSPVVPDVAYHMGQNVNGRSGLDLNMVYKITFTDEGDPSNYSPYVDIIPDNTGSSAYYMGMKGAITGDGKYIVLGGSAGDVESAPYHIVQLLPENDRRLRLSINAPAIDTSWGDSPTVLDNQHDQWVAGNSAHGYWMYALTNSTWWRMRLWGSDGGAPDHTQDTTSSGSPDWYDWLGDSGWNTEGQTPDNAAEEIQVANSRDPVRPAFHIYYWSHVQGDPWGTHVAYSGWNGYGAPTAENTNTHTVTGRPDSSTSANYHTWCSYSDYAAGAGGVNAGSMYAMRYNDGSDFIDIGESNTSDTSDYPHPCGPSPDGTKMTIRTDWLQPTKGDNAVSDLLMGVIHYPHPPEITACTATGGTVTVRFDWRLATTPRGYTLRGWPNEITDNPPPPRETSFFRLWRSSNGTTWTPLGTTDAEIFSRYDFSDGTWVGNDYWTITDTPGDGTWYYAVTSVEWSGLESHCLSNVYTVTVSGGGGTGSQSVAYPASPGDLDDIAASDFHTSFVTESKSIIRHYNIYAEDGSAPTVSQTNRIASIPVSACSDGSCSWVDWLGATDGSTQYVVTAVDTQGNESNGTFVTAQSYSVLATDGQYSITWDDMYEAYSGDSGSSSPTHSGVSGTVSLH